MTFPILSREYDGANTTFRVADLLHLREGLIVEIDGVDHAVTEVKNNCEKFTVAGDVEGLFVSYPRPFFFHGTPYATNAKLSRLKDPNKVPFVYLLEIIRIEGRGIWL